LQTNRLPEICSVPGVKVYYKIIDLCYKITKL